MLRLAVSMPLIHNAGVSYRERRGIETVNGPPRVIRTCKTRSWTNANACRNPARVKRGRFIRLFRSASLNDLL
jgi:hypothetical protein